MSQTDFIDLFNAFPDWQERYRYIIELGELLPTMPDNLKIPENRVLNCPSVLYFHISFNPIIFIQADGNSPVSLGLAGLLAHLFNGLTREEMTAQSCNFYIDTRLIENLSIHRKNALIFMWDKLRR